MTELGADLPRVDVITGGFPCQDLSIAGKRAGITGQRSGLFYHMTRLVDGLRPAVLLWENVPGLLTGNGGRDFAAVLLELERIGYRGGWTTLDARHFGLAQRRRRIFGVFAPGDLGAGRAAAVLALATRMSGYPPPGREARERVAPAPEARARGGGGGWGTDFLAGGGLAASISGHSSPRGDESDTLVPTTADPLSASEGRTYTHEGSTFRLRNVVPAGEWPAEQAPTLDATFGDKWGQDNQHIGAGAPLFVPVSAAVTSKWAKQSGGPAGSETGNLVLAPALRVGGRADGAGSSADNTPIVAQPVRSNPRNNSNPATEATMHVAAPSGIRRLTPLECERLQGFPDGWTGLEGMSDTHRYRMLGNAVAVPCAAWIARRLAAELTKGDA